MPTSEWTTFPFRLKFRIFMTKNESDFKNEIVYFALIQISNRL